jgi:tRNA (guanine-N7-)-methyltransferase
MVPDSIRMIYLHFPVPPRKSRVWRHRIFEQAFLDQVWRVLEENGRISVITDQRPSFQDMLGLAAADDRFQLIREEPFELQLDDSLKSHNQIVWEGRGHSVMRFEMVKR